MPSSQEIIRNVNRRLRSTSRKTLGVAAASAAVAGVVAGAALSAAPAHGATSPLAEASHPAAISAAAGTAGANTLDVSAKPLMNSGVTGSAATAAHHATVRDDAAVTKRPARAAHAAATTHQAAHSATVHTVSRQQPAPAHHAPPAPPAQPYQFYDSVTPSAIPSGHEIATYADGPFAVSPSQVAGQKVLWIDTNGSDPSANVLDVEPGDATPSQAATWTQQKLSADPNATAIIYTMQSEWPATQSAIGTLPSWMQSHVRWWIANPTGYPNMVPGANATQWYWGPNYDISTANPGF
jgi:hypothetical protein